jgi:hypothetical protein
MKKKPTPTRPLDVPLPVATPVLTAQERREGWHLSQLGKTRTLRPVDADDDENRVLCDFDPNDY